MTSWMSGGKVSPGGAKKPQWGAGRSLGSQVCFNKISAEMSGKGWENRWMGYVCFI